MRPPRRPQGELVTVASYPDALRAHLAKGRLEAEGIPAVVADEYYVSLNWMMSNALGGVKVQVEKGVAERAAQVVRALEEGAFALAGEEAEPLPTEKVRCPRCGEASVEARSSDSWRVALLGVHLFQLPLPFRRMSYRCRVCGHDFRA